ncbi:MAG: helicase C-terminal domain-containing protein [Rhodanobacter sp.]
MSTQVVLGRVAIRLLLEGRVVDVVSHSTPRVTMTPETIQTIRALLEALSTRLHGFQRREAQDRMINAIARVLEQDDAEARICVVEAPTGIGKSLAYLIAGLATAKPRKKRLVVATATIALQNQLVEDAGLLCWPDGKAVTAAMVKGRGRYLCDRNLAELHGEGGDQIELQLGEADAVAGAWPFQPNAVERAAVNAMWLDRRASRWSGDLDQTTTRLSPRLKAVITTTASGCAGDACRWRTVCPALRARWEAQRSDVIVTNHALLLADSRHEGQGILPDPRESIVILDEAHHIEAAAIEATAVSVRLDKAQVSAKDVGAVLRRAAGHLGKQLQPTQWAKVQAATAAIAEALAEVRNALVRQHPDLGTSAHIARVYGQPAIRPFDGIESLDLACIEMGRDAARSLASLLDRGRRKLVTDLAGSTAATAAAKSARELGQIGDHVGDAAAVLDRLAREIEGHAGAPVAAWAERDAQGRVELRVCEISAARWLRTHLWERFWGAALTSATLRSLGEMGTFLRGVGLYRMPGVHVGQLPSPFDLATAAVLEVPTMATDPSDRDAFARECATLIESRLDTRDGTLIVCASRDLLDTLLACLPPTIREKVRVQGEGPITELLEGHIRDVRAGHGAILAGLSTLSEGINLPGELCTHVIIVQMPFARIDHPLVAKRAEWLDKQGIGSFAGMLLPEAHRRLTQTCGRLIRTETDRGRITVLDGRLLTRKYGKKVIDTLPPYRKVVGS